MGKTAGLYLGVAYIYLLILYKRNILSIWVIVIANSLLFLIQSRSTQIIISIFCFVNIFMLYFIEYLSLATLFNLYSIPNKIRLLVKFTMILLLFSIQLSLIYISFK